MTFSPRVSDGGSRRSFYMTNNAQLRYSCSKPDEEEREEGEDTWESSWAKKGWMTENPLVGCNATNLPSDIDAVARSPPTPSAFFHLCEGSVDLLPLHGPSICLP